MRPFTAGRYKSTLNLPLTGGGHIRRVRSRRPSDPCHLPGGAAGAPCPHDGMGGSPLCRCYWLGQSLSGPAGGKAEGMLWAAGACRHYPSAEKHGTGMALELETGTVV